METYPIILKTTDKSLALYPDQDLYKITSNPLEISLAVKLTSSLGKYFFNNQKVGYYYPDITYIDAEKNILIDIEIDEPYSLSGKPIHYVGDINDDQRNKFFIQNGWYVIRFSEFQIKNRLSSVIKSMELLIQAIQNESFCELVDFTKTFLDNRWTYIEAFKSIKDKKREYYNFKTKQIDQKEVRIKYEVPSIQHLYEQIINSYFPDFDYREEMVFLPYFISDNYLNPNNGSKMVFIDCLTSQGKIQMNNRTYRFNHFSNYPRIEVIKNTDSDKYDLFTGKKMNNLQIFVKQSAYNIHYFYDFFLFGTMQEYREQCLKVYHEY